MRTTITACIVEPYSNNSCNSVTNSVQSYQTGMQGSYKIQGILFQKFKTNSKVLIHHFQYTLYYKDSQFFNQQ